jgi:hypothetical protein
MPGEAGAPGAPTQGPVRYSIRFVNADGDSTIAHVVTQQGELAAAALAMQHLKGASVPLARFSYLDIVDAEDVEGPGADDLWNPWD